MKISANGLNLIKQFEGCILHPYLDSIKKPTIGIGTIHYEDGTPVTMQDPPITEERALELLSYYCETMCKEVSSLLTSEVNQNQFDALCCFAYNVGGANLAKSTLLKLVNAGDILGASQNFIKWNKAGGQEIPGLTKRRLEECRLFLTPVEESEEPTSEEINSQLADIEKQ